MLSIALTTVISYILALINIGSSVAFNDLVSLTINGLYGSYFIGNSLLLWRRVARHIRPYNSEDKELTNVSNDNLSWGPTHIPEPFGTIINAFGCMFLFVMLFFSFWPPAVNPTAATMNMSSVMVGATVIWSVIYYAIWARKVYTGPVIEIS